MMTPAANPVTTEKLTPNQLVMPKKYKMRKVAMAISTAATLVPRLKDFSKSFIVASSLVRTKKIPIRLKKIPTAAIIIGATTALSCMSPLATKAVAPNAAVDKILPQ